MSRGPITIVTVSDFSLSKYMDKTPSKGIMDILTEEAMTAFRFTFEGTSTKGMDSPEVLRKWRSGFVRTNPPIKRNVVWSSQKSLISP